MGRKNKYESHVQPNLEKIADWIQILNEDQIARRLGISQRSFEKYKAEHEELREALKHGKEALVEELKMTLKKKAQGFTYKETKRTIRKVNGENVVTMEEFERYAQPDLGAIHLLLKNLDPDWHNDDQTTINQKQQKIELEKERTENNNW